MTDAERIRDLELRNAHLEGEVAGLRAVLEVMKHLLPVSAPVATELAALPAASTGRGGAS